MPPPDNQGQDRPKVFVSYSHCDDVWKHRVVRHLQALELEGKFEVWEDLKIEAGTDWLPAITNAIDRASVAVLLVSVDFLVSRFILGEEVPRLLKRRSENGLRIIPLVVKPCAWQRVGWLSALQARPRNGTPLLSMGDADAEAALSNFAAEIYDLLETARTDGKLPPPSEPDGTATTKQVPAAMTAGMLRMQGVIRLDQIERKVPKLLSVDRPYAVAEAIEAALPLPVDDSKSFGTAAWAIDYYLGRSADTTEREFAVNLRNRVFAPLREHIPPPRLNLSHWAWWLIQGGSFRMGSETGNGNEKPAHDVTVSPFYLGACTVTNKDFRRLKATLQGEDDLPVNVDWYTAYAYAAWLGGRLPTEAEWEYACRAGTKTIYSSGNEESDLVRVASYGGKTPHPVGEKAANPWGIHDMHGNVREWVADWFGPYEKEPMVDPWGPAEGNGRIVRGGGYSDSLNWMTAASRINLDSQSAVGNDVGFRVALPADPTTLSKA